MSFDLPLPLLIVFGLSFATIFSIYWVSGRISARAKTKSAGKTAPYACGENFPAEEMRFDMEKFLVFALYFLIFDILAFVLATSFYTIGLMPTVYALIVLTSVVVLILSGRYR